MEYLSLTAFLLIAVGIFFAFALVYFGNANATNLSNNAVNSLAATGNQLVGFGSGSSSVIVIDLPDGVDSLSSDHNNVIELRISAPFGQAEYWAATDANISPTGFLDPASSPPSSGKHWVRVSYIDGYLHFNELS